MATGGKIVRVVIKAEDQVSRVFKQMQRQLDRLERATLSTNRTVQRMGATATSQYSRVSQGISTATRNQNAFNSSVVRSFSPLKQLGDAIKTIAVTYLGMNAAETIIKTSDAVTLSTARLKLFNDGLQTTEELTEMIYQSAQRSRGSYLDMMDLVSKYSAVASDKFGSTQNVVAFTETLQKMFTVSGATGQEIYSAALQLKQALGTGRLMGEEFRAVSEAAPLYTQAIAEYMTGIGKWGEVGIGDLKKLASESQITADVMIGAMFAASDDINKKFEDMPYTFDQTWTQMKNTVIRSLDEVWKKLTSLLSNGELDKFFSILGGAIVTVANVMVLIFSAAVKIFNFISDNWSLIAPIVWTIVLALAAMNIQLLIAKTRTVALFIVGAISKIFGVFASVITMVRMAIGLYTGSTAAASAVTLMFGSTVAFVISLIAIGIIIIIGLVYLVVAAINKVTGATISATGVIMGAIFTLGAFIWNIVVGVLKGLLQLIDTAVNIVISIVEWVLNVINGGFNSFGDAVANLIGTIIGWFLSLGTVVTTIIDAIFGTNWTAGLKSLKSSVTKWGKNEQAITLERSSLSDNLAIDRLGYGDAYKSGYKFGQGIDDKVGSMFGGLGSGGLDSLGSELPSWEDFSTGLGDIAGDVGDIADNTSISSEDLKYLRQLATQRAVNRFTTAEIKIDMQNSNTITGTQDIDGIVSALEEKLYESMSIAAEGVHI